MVAGRIKSKRGGEGGSITFSRARGKDMEDSEKRLKMVCEPFKRVPKVKLREKLRTWRV